MSGEIRICARCGAENQEPVRFCRDCALPMSEIRSSPTMGFDLLTPTGEWEPVNSEALRIVHDLVTGSGFDHAVVTNGYRVKVELPRGRHQAVYVGHVGYDREDRPKISLISICGPVNDRDCRSLLKHNASTVDGHFAIKTLKDEDYFVYIHNVAAESVSTLDSRRLIRRIAETADQLEQKLSRGGDVF